MNQNFTVLLAEDEPNDMLLTKIALQRADIDIPLKVVQDGEETIEYLRGEKKYADRKMYPLPGILLLDIHMPKKNGFEVLEWLRKDSENGLKRLPVIIMSTSDEQKDIDRAYELGVNAYLIKPDAFKKLVETLKTVTNFWKKLAAHPKI
ncbi:MAG: response regulator [Limisphaerales bacterium]